MSNIKKIGDCNYEVTPFVASQGYKLALKLASFIPDMSVPAYAMARFAEEDKDLKLTYELLSCVLQDGKSIDEKSFNLRFDGNKFSDIPAVIAYVIEVNFTGFFCTLQETLATIFKAKAEQVTVDA